MDIAGRWVLIVLPATAAGVVILLWGFKVREPGVSIGRSARQTIAVAWLLLLPSLTLLLFLVGMLRGESPSENLARSIVVASMALPFCSFLAAEHFFSRARKALSAPTPSPIPVVRTLLSYVLIASVGVPALGGLVMALIAVVSRSMQ